MRRGNGGRLSQTFGERITAIEEQVQTVSEMLAAILQIMGLIDSEGNWLEVDVDQADSVPADAGRHKLEPDSSGKNDS